MLLHHPSGVLLHLLQVQMAVGRAGKPRQGQLKHHISLGLGRAGLQIFLQRKCPAELHCSQCQLGLPAAMPCFASAPQLVL